MRVGYGVLKNFLRRRRCPNSENTTSLVVQLLIKRTAIEQSIESRTRVYKRPGTKKTSFIVFFDCSLAVSSLTDTHSPHTAVTRRRRRIAPGSSITRAIHRRRQTPACAKLSPARFSRPGHPSPKYGTRLCTSYRYNIFIHKHYNII